MKEIDEINNRIGELHKEINNLYIKKSEIQTKKLLEDKNNEIFQLAVKGSFVSLLLSKDNQRQVFVGKIYSDDDADIVLQGMLVDYDSIYISFDNIRLDEYIDNLQDYDVQIIRDGHLIIEELKEFIDKVKTELNKLTTI